ncbi:hypothetical protein KIH74_00705 [Kineosporia sp. J2-2]|uniref:GlsB/YeaQ/YmgE family stress response membrane protein n=1 Tax=Kineosporia corallincola TaxID=2835133 RepID=A0ABS5T8L8_9ACTN|nr:hypothetical protein [Kineosporia corallincola]MBT0767420.1 hypothetical protein [Kineosporia corallincola]
MPENTGPSSAIVMPAWLAVVGGLVGNTVASFAGDVLVVHLALGLLTTAGVVALVLNWLHRR